MNRLLRWLIDGPEIPDATYRQRLAAWDQKHPIKPLDLPAVKPLKAERESEKVWRRLRRA